MSAYQAIRQPRHTGTAAWNALLPQRRVQAPLTESVTADIVIVGAGFAGLSAARRITQLEPTATVVILEAGELAESAAGRNSGFMIDLPHDLASDNYAGAQADADKRMTALNRQAIQFSQDAVTDYAINAAYFDPCGKVNGAAGSTGEKHNRDYLTHLETLNEPCEWLDEHDMHALTGSRHYRSGLYTPGTVMLQPAGYIRAFADGLIRGGLVRDASLIRDSRINSAPTREGNTGRVRLFEHAGVTAFKREGATWQVSTNTGSVSTPTIILANNGHLESFGIERSRLMHLFLYASMTRTLTPAEIKTLGGASRWGITPADPMGTTVRRIDHAQGGHRIITRTCATYCPNMIAPDHELKRAAGVHRTKFTARFPQLAHMAMEYQWAGHLCLSKNGVSVMREIDRGVYSACVQNGLGTARGTLTGIGAAELALGVTSDITHFFDAEPHPTPLPPKPLATAGANVYLRWKEWRAGVE